MKFLRSLLISTVVIVGGIAQAINVVRDAEVEEILREITGDIFKVAGLRPKSAKVYVINSETINAFTIGNGYIFINSGLLLQFENPLHLMAILCHETGHIAAGHINRHINVIQQRSKNFMLVALAGMLGAALTGSQESIALLLGYAMTDERFYLRFSRGEEMAADALAATYLEKLGYGADVLIEAFSTFQRLDILNGGINLPVYIRTHPKTSDRISALQKRAKFKNYKADQKLATKYNRLLIKLKAYLKKPQIKTTILSDDYSKAIYFHRMGRSKEAIDILRKLVKTNPLDIFYQETLAQTLYEAGRLEESIQIYEKIYHNDINVLIKIDYANVLIEANKKIDLAISILEATKYEDNFNSDIYRLLAKGYGKQKREGLSLLMLAQEQMLLQHYRSAQEMLTGCLKKLNKKTELSHIKKAKYFKELLEREHGIMD
ncbi:MAG: M48 family metalloprotease [Holosporaceae bacterium]|jgi:predicted Zn-dependent protease|nr:M48 family metalloprotease [Holosporaceae bacterium]